MEKAKEPENKLDQSLSEETLKDVSGGRDPFSRITYRVKCLNDYCDFDLHSSDRDYAWSEYCKHKETTGHEVHFLELD